MSANQPTSFFRSRGVVNTVNYQMPFSYAKKLGYDPKKMYWHIQDHGFSRVKQVVDFYVSIHQVNPSFFWFKKDGEVDGQDDQKAEHARFCRYIFSALKKNQTLHEKFAGPRYFDEGWGSQKAGATEGAKQAVL